MKLHLWFCVAFAAIRSSFGTVVETSSEIEHAITTLQRFGNVSSVIGGPAVTNLDPVVQNSSTPGRLAKIKWANGSQIGLQDGHMTSFRSANDPSIMADSHMRKTGSSNTGFKFRPLGTNRLDRAQAIENTKQFVKALGVDPEEVFMDLEPKVIESLKMGADAATIDLIWLEPGESSAAGALEYASLRVTWHLEKRELLGLFAIHPAFYGTNLIRIRNSGRVVNDWSSWTDKRPDLIDSLIRTGINVPELSEIARRLERGRLGRSIPSQTHSNIPQFDSIVTTDRWQIAFANGQVEGWTAPDSLYRNNAVGKLLNHMRAPARLGKDEAIEKVKEALQNIGRKDLSKWIGVTKPEVKLPNTVGRSFLSRIFFEWEKFFDDPDKMIRVIAEVDLANGDVKTLRILGPLNYYENSRPK